MKILTTEGLLDALSEVTRAAEPVRGPHEQVPEIAPREGTPDGPASLERESFDPRDLETAVAAIAVAIDSIASAAGLPALPGQPAQPAAEATTLAESLEVQPLAAPHGDEN